MIGIAAEVIKYVGPLLIAIYKQGLDGKSQKEIAQAVNRDEVWVSRRVEVGLTYKLLEVKEEYRWGRHRTYGTYAKWKVNAVYLTKDGIDTAKTLLQLDPVKERCPKCGTLLDVTGYSGYVRCSVCEHVLYVEGIEPMTIGDLINDIIEFLSPDFRTIPPLPRGLVRELQV